MSSFDPGELFSSFGRGYFIEHQIFLPTESIYFIVNEQSKQQLPLCVKIWEKRLWEYLSYLIMQSQEIWPLHYQPTHALDNLDRIRLLAPEIYSLHMHLSKDDKKTKLSQKVDSIELLLWESSVNKFFSGGILSLLPWSEQLRYANEVLVIEHVYRAYRGSFIQHSTRKQVKCCHEALKATDLWIQTTSDMVVRQLSRVSPSLKPGGIDFLPEPYSINTLSNSAMPTVSMETYSSIDRKKGVTSFSQVLYSTKFADKDARPAEEEHIYKIEKIVESASAFVCIAYTQDDTEQRLVLKILREYKDERYHYGSPEERLTCQKEALRKNVNITPGVYRGLARILRSTLQELEDKCQVGKLQSITLGTIIQKDDEIDHINTGSCEYALVMSYLSDKQRLDILLQEEGIGNQKELLYLLTMRIEQMHKSFLPPINERDEYGNIWGSKEQLENKLKHNLKHFDFIQKHYPVLYKQYKQLKNTLEYFINHLQLQYAFEHRKSKYIKECHGDLKTKHIWIDMTKQDDDPLQGVRILDAVDFNESYRNIDVLADLAMIVVDVEAIGSEDLGAYLEKEYLALSGQAEEAAKLVLTYYLLEKAIVCAIVCIVYDHCEPSIGHRFLELAQKHANELRGLINPPAKENPPRMQFNSK